MGPSDSPDSLMLPTRCGADALIDDKAEMVHAWADAWPDGVGFIWRMRHNEGAPEYTGRGTVVAVDTWDDVVKELL